MPQRISRQYQGRQRAGGPHLGGGNPFFGGGYGGGHQDGRPDPYEMADYLHGLQQETAAQHHAYQMQRDENHVNLQARLHEIQLTQTERRRLERMREAISHVETDSSLTPDARNDLIMQLRTGMSPLNARLHEQQALRNEIQNRMLEQEETRNRLNLRATQDMLAPGNYDPASGTTIINRGTPNEVRMLFNGTSWVIVPQREANPPVVTPQMYNAVRASSLAEATSLMNAPPFRPLPSQRDQTAEQREQSEREHEAAYRARVRREYGVPANLSLPDAIHWIADRRADRSIDSTVMNAVPQLMHAQRQAAARIADQERAVGLEQDRLHRMPFSPERDAAYQQAAAIQSSLGTMRTLLETRPIERFSPEQQTAFLNANLRLPVNIASRLAIPGMPAVSESVQAAGTIGREVADAMGAGMGNSLGNAAYGAMRNAPVQFGPPTQGGMAPAVQPPLGPVPPPRPGAPMMPVADPQVRPMPMIDPDFQPLQPPREMMPAPPVKPPQNFQVPGFEDVVPVPHNVPAAIGGGVGAFGATQMPMPPQAGPVPQNVPAAIGGGLAAYGRMPLPEVPLPRPEEQGQMNEQQMHEMAMEQAIREEEERRRNQSE